MGNRDYYDIMGLDPDADGAMVEQQYWQLAKAYNASDDPRAQAQLDELNEGYGVLGTPRLREQYDAFRLDVELTRGKPLRAPKARNEGKGGLLGLRLPRLGRHDPPLGPPPIAEVPAPAPPRIETSAPAAVAERAGQPRRGRGGSQDLQESTAAMLGRWRQSNASRGATPVAEDEPDTTLVEIFQSEHAIDEPDEPLTAALDVLRGSSKSGR